MTDGTVGVANLTGSTTKKVDVAEVTVGSNTVERQRVVLADNTSNNYAVIDASGFLSVNIAGAVALPTGAATAAKQPALGTAGTASADVITVQGVASMTALKVDGSAVTQPVSGTLSITANSAVNVGQINAVTPLMGNGVTGTGSQRVTIASDNTAFSVNAVQSATWTVQPGNTANTTAWKVDGSAVTQPVSLATNTPVGNVAAAAADSGNPLKVGAKYNATTPTYADGNRTDLQADLRGSLKVTLFGSDSATSGGINLRTADGITQSVGGLEVNAASYLFNGTTTDRGRSVVNTLNSTGTGIAAAGIVAQLDDTAPTAVTENQFGPVRMNASRALNISAKPDTLGGLTTGRVVTGTTGAIKASAGQVYGINVYNVNAALRWLHLYNKATAPTLSTDTPLWSIAIPPTSQVVIQQGDIGVAFGTGIAWAYTTDNVAIPATAGTSAEMLLTVLYN